MEKIMNHDFPRDNEFLLPARVSFIILSLLVAVMINWLPWRGWALALRPDCVALVLLYWCTHKPHRVGIGIAWCVGILADVADASLFGQHALAYTVLAFGGAVLHRRIQMLDLQQQSIQVLPLLLFSYVAYAFVHWQVRGYVAWEYFLGAFVSAAMWIPLTVLLQTLRRPRANPNEL
jgi:rod shape-determining protein MreD